MTPPDEDWVRRRLEDGANSLSMPPHLPESIVAQVPQSRRASDRNRSFAAMGLAAGFVVVAITTAVAVFSAQPGETQRASTTSPSPTASASPSRSTKVEGPPVFTWAQSLPRGDDARAVYDVGGTLYAGNQHLQLSPGMPVTAVYASTPGGWFVSSPTIDGASTNVLLRSDGSYVTLPYPATGARETFDLSPDEREVIYHKWILDAQSGQILYRLPRDVGYVDAWTPTGIFYHGNGHSSWWWTPGNRKPVHLDRQYDFRSDGLGVTIGEINCTTVVQAGRGGTVTDLMEYCTNDGDRILELSPSGQLAVTESGAIVGVPAGDVAATLSVPATFINAYPDSVLWEDEENILFVISDWDANYRQPKVIVRCNTQSGLCERASPTLKDKYSFIHMLPMSPSAARDGTT